MVENRLVYRVQPPRGMLAADIRAIRGKVDVNYPPRQITWNTAFAAVIDEYQPGSGAFERLVRECLQTHEAGGCTTWATPA